MNARSLSLLPLLQRPALRTGMFATLLFAACMGAACSAPLPDSDGAAEAPADDPVTEASITSAPGDRIAVATNAGPQAPPVEPVDLVTAPDSERVDLGAPTFSDPTNVTNPLFPITDLHSAILMGKIDGLSFRAETTLLAETKTIEWDGRQVETLVSQYVAYLDGRIHEVALDWYAQADDGSVWYFGEDVFNYEDGVVADTEGTWLAGKDGPAAMIMPGQPRVGDVYRPENIPGFVFEEVTIKTIDHTVRGPRGQVDNAIIVEELHMDGSFEDKVFAPGYGEFLTGTGGDLEALALGVPTDAATGPAPKALETLLSGSRAIFAAAAAGDWAAATSALDTMVPAHQSIRMDDLPPMLDAQLAAAMVTLTAAVNAKQGDEARQAATGAERASLDLQLQYVLPAAVDLDRFRVEVRQLRIDVDHDDVALVRGDVATLETLRDRFVNALSTSNAENLSGALDDLRAAADDGDLLAVSESVVALQDSAAEMSLAR